MSNLVGTYDHTLVNMAVEGVELSDFLGDITITKEGDEWEVTEGSNGCIERSRMVRRLYTVTVPFMQTSPQLAKLEALRIADEETKAGPYLFSFVDLNGPFSILGQCWIHSMGTVTRGRAATARTVTLRVKGEAVFEG